MQPLRFTPLPLLLLLACTLAPAAAQGKEEITGEANYLRAIPKHFATLQAVDVSQRKVTLLLEGEKEAREWSLIPDAEVKVTGWWGQLDQLTLKDRVWVWFATDASRKPIAIALLADEMSEQDMHGSGVKIAGRTDASLTIPAGKGKKRTLQTANASRFAVGQQVYVQSQGDRARRVLTPKAFEGERTKQKKAMRTRWIEQGLPGSVTFLHRFSGEMEVMLDHAALRWGRSLTPGDKVELRAGKSIPGVVKQVQPWRERTQVRLVVSSFAQADLHPAQRLHLSMPAPPEQVDLQPWPPLRNIPKDREARIAWFLANIYCTCKVGGNGCTGHYYTLAGCNPNKCGMPNQIRKLVGEMIDKGRTDEQIFQELRSQKGPKLLLPHLLP